MQLMVWDSKSKLNGLHGPKVSQNLWNFYVVGKIYNTAVELLLSLICVNPNLNKFIHSFSSISL